MDNAKDENGKPDDGKAFIIVISVIIACFVIYFIGFFWIERLKINNKKRKWKEIGEETR